MLRLIIGRTGSGKTERVYSEIKKTTESSESSAVIIVPEQYSFETEKNIIRRLGAVKAHGVGVYSFTFLAKLLLKQTGVSFSGEISDSDRAMIMALAVEEVSDELCFYNKAKHTPGFITDIAGMIKELRQCAVTPDDLLDCGKKIDDEIFKNKLSDLSLIQRAYTAVIENSFLDEETSLDLLHGNIDKTDWFKGKTVFIDGFRGFTSQELIIIGDILSRADDVFVTLCADKIAGLYEKNSAFAHTRRTAAELINLNAKIFGGKAEIITTDYNSKKSRPDLDTLEKNLYSLTPSKYDGTPRNITLCAAENFLYECDYAASSIKKLIASGDYRCRDIAVIARDAKSYERQIKASLLKYGVPVYIDKRQPVAAQPIIAMADAALDIAASGFSAESIMRLLKTGLTDLDGEQVSELENYAIMWQIKPSGWGKDFTGHPEGLGEAMLEKHREQLEKINKIRRYAVGPLFAFRQALKDADAQSAAKALYELVISYRADEHLRELASALAAKGEYDLAGEQDSAWNIFIQIIESIAAASAGRKLTAKRFHSLFSLMVSCSSVGALPTGLDEVTVGAADRVQLSSPKVVFAVGVNDGVFPFVQISKKILSRRERETLSVTGIKLSQSAEEDIMEERFIAYNTLCAACERLYVTYTEKSLTGVPTPPSELVHQLKKIFPGIETVHTSDIPEIDFAQSEASAFEIMAKNYMQDTVEENSLKAYFESRPDYAGKMKAIERAARKKQFRIEDAQTAQKLFGQNMYISSTRAEVFFKCPFQYFCRFGINLKPVKKAELDPMQAGRAVHFVLENILKENSTEKLLQMTGPEIEKAVADLLGMYFEMNMSAQDSSDGRFKFLYSNLAGSLCGIVKRMIKEFSVSEYIPVDFELPIEKDSEVKPLKIGLSNGGTLQVKGFVDRVDMMKTDDVSFVRVIDYKLNGKEFRLSDVFYGLNMQMLIYLFSIWHNGTGRYSGVTPAGILYMPAKSAFSSLPRNAAEQDILAQQIKDQQMEGILLDDSRSIYGMDKEKSGAFIPVKYDAKNNCFKGRLIDFGGLMSLYEMLCSLLKNMGDSLHSGKIEALPVYSDDSGSAYSDACAYCDYKSVCGFEKNDARRQIAGLSDSDCIKILKGGETDA